MKTTLKAIALTAATTVAVGFGAVSYAQDLNRGHGRGPGHNGPDPLPTPSFTPPGHHYGWDRGKGNPHHSSPSPTAAPTSSPTATAAPTAAPTATPTVTPTPTP